MASSLLTRLTFMTSVAVMCGAATDKAPKVVGYRADSCTMKAGGGDRTVACTGHISIWREDLKLTCEKLTASFKDGNLSNAVCTGDVKIVAPENTTATATEATFDNHKNKVELRGKPSAVQPGTSIKAKVIKIDLESGEISSEGGVEGVHWPQKAEGK